MIIFNAKAYLNSRFKVKSTSRSVEFRVNCIYCDDTKFHMYVNIRKQLYNCYKCDSGGTLFQLIYDTDKCKSYGQAREVMQEFMGDVDKELGKVQYARSNLAAKIPEFISLATGENEQYYDYAVGWLAHRGIDLELAKYYGMGYCLVGRYENRIVVPIYSEGRLRSFVARAWSDGIEPKTFNPMINEADSPSNFLFGIDECPVGGIVYIVEGVFDALAMRHFGYNAIAIGSSYLHAFQFACLTHKFKRITVCFDNDFWGHYGAYATSKCLRAPICFPRLKDISCHFEAKIPLQLDYVNQVDLHNKLLIEIANYNRKVNNNMDFVRDLPYNQLPTKQQ